MNRLEFLEFNKYLSWNKARLLRGPIGIGKTSLIRALARELGYAVISLSLAEYEPADLVGLPYIELGKTYYAKPSWWPLGEKAILVLEEIDRCHESMHPLAMSLALGRQVGGHTLPNGVIVYATCNGNSLSNIPLDQALISRFAVIDYTPTASEWIDWASTDGTIHPWILDYIKANPIMLDTPVDLLGKPDIQVPCRRAWAELSWFLKSIPKNLIKLDAYAVPFIGKAAALAFQAWMVNGQKPLSTAEIFNGNANHNDYSVVQLVNAANRVATELPSQPATAQYKALKFFMGSGEEVFASLLSMLDDDTYEIITQYDDVMLVADKIIGQVP